MDVKWIKITTNMFDDEKIRIIESLPDGDSLLVIWIKLLAQAGKTNANGYILLNENIPYTDEMLATIFRRPLNTIRLALETFRKFGMIEWDESGVLVLNWEKHQNIEGLDKVREQNRLRAAKHREKKKASRYVTEKITQSNGTELELELELEDNTNTYCQDSTESLTHPPEKPSQPTTAKKSNHQRQAEELIEYYNNLKGHHPIKPTPANTADIIRRLKEGNEMEACKAVIFFKKQVLTDEMAMYWTPVSIFRKSNFYRFLESVKLKLQNDDFRKSIDNG